MSRRAVCAIALAFALGFVYVSLYVQLAYPHTRFCGHSSAKVWKTTPWGLVEYRDVYANASGSGPHWHTYRTFYRTGSQWVFVHSHTRWCKPHAV